MRKFCPDMLRDPCRQRPGERLVGVGVARAFIPGQLQAGQRVGGQVLLSEVATGRPSRSRSSAAAEAAQQIAAVVATPRPDDHLCTDIGACFRQRQHDVLDDRPRLGGLAASSSASMITLNRAPPRPVSASRMAGARSSGSPGRAADAARAISSATSSAVLPLACTAQLTDPRLARTALSPGGSDAADVGIRGGDDPAEHRRLTHPRGAGHHQHPPVWAGAVQPGQ